MGKKDKIKQRLLASFLFFVLLAVITPFLARYSDKPQQIHTIDETFRRTFAEKRRLAEAGLEDLIRQSDELGSRKTNVLFLDDKFRDQKENNISLFLYEQDRLVFWTDQSIPIPGYYVYNYFINSMINPGNGYYYPLLKKQGDKKYLALIKIKDEYPVTNHYLNNRFLPGFGVPNDARIVSPGSEDLILSDDEGHPLFAIKVPETFGPISEMLITVFSGALIAVFFLMLYYAVHFIKNRKAAFVFVLLSSGISGFLLISDAPQSLFAASRLPIFGPEMYAGKFFSSLGLLVVFAIWMLYSAYALGYVLPRLFHAKTSRFNVGYLLLMPAISIGLVYFMYRLIEDLVLNSLVYPTPDRLPDMTFYSLAVALSLLVIFHSLRLFLNGIGKTGHSESLNRSRPYILVLIPLAVAGALVTNGATLFVVPAAILAYAGLNPKLTDNLFHVLLVSLSGGILFTLASVKPMNAKKDTEAAVIASKMALENDPLTEYLYENVKNRIYKDEDFIKGIYSSTRLTSDFTDLIIKKYFNGYWLKYGITAGVFDSRTRSRLNINNSGVNDFEYYNEIIENSGVSTPIDGLFFVRKPSGRISYIARLDFVDSLRYGMPKRTVFFEFNSRIINETAGLPDILLDNSFLSNQLLEGYSYARYTNNRLVNENGSFPYYTDLAPWLVMADGKDRVLSEGYVHYIQRNSKDDTIIISRRAQNNTDYFNRFSWWFLAVLIGLGFERFVVLRPGDMWVWKNAGFKRKIQAVTLVTVTAFFIVMVRGSVFYLEKQHETQNTRNVIEKLHSVAINLEETMGGRLSRINDQKGYLEYRLSELGNLFGTDINVYDTRGFLISGSRPELFTSGFISNRLHPEAVDFLKNKNLTEFIRNEHIGKLKYISAYAPLIDEDGKTVAFLNIPYFLKQKEINEELTESVNSLVNIFIGAITLLLTMVLLVTNRITDPLRELGKRLSELRYGNKTAKITYDGQDEIGDLVKEYNRLAEELEQSARLLAEKERDSAWREMARQVAHEIKNPLTPMKLNVEFLEKAWKDGNPDFQVRLARFRSIMIEQIDTLSHIADEFSNFAKLPPPQNEATDLSEILSGAAGLYANNEQNVAVHYVSGGHPIPVWADKEHLLRVFNNLVKNAIQAIPEGKAGKVEVFAFTDDRSVTVLVKDNGSGIPEALRDRIFVPNFTTKSTGSGLGLAICRNIIREAGGNIDFMTKTGEGTTFRVTLPLYK